MTGMFPYTPSYDYTHMWNMKDLRGKYPIICYDKNSLMGILDSRPDTKIFSYLVKKSKLESVLNSQQANCTLFVPGDAYMPDPESGWLENIDIGYAYNLVKTCMVDRRLSSEVLESSPAMYVMTKNPPNRLFISNINGICKINNEIEIMEPNVMANNGLIHITNRLLTTDWILNEQ